MGWGMSCCCCFGRSQEESPFGDSSNLEERLVPDDDEHRLVTRGQSTSSTSSTWEFERHIPGSAAFEGVGYRPFDDGEPERPYSPPQYDEWPPTSHREQETPPAQWHGHGPADSEWADPADLRVRKAPSGPLPPLPFEQVRKAPSGPLPPLPFEQVRKAPSGPLPPLPFEQVRKAPSGPLPPLPAEANARLRTDSDPLPPTPIEAARAASRRKSEASHSRRAGHKPTVHVQQANSAYTDPFDSHGSNSPVSPLIATALPPYESGQATPPNTHSNEYVNVSAVSSPSSPWMVVDAEHLNDSSEEGGDQPHVVLNDDVYEQPADERPGAQAVVMIKGDMYEQPADERPGARAVVMIKGREVPLPSKASPYAIPGDVGRGSRRESAPQHRTAVSTEGSYVNVPHDTALAAEDDDAAPSFEQSSLRPLAGSSRAPRGNTVTRGSRPQPYENLWPQDSPASE